MTEDAPKRRRRRRPRQITPEYLEKAALFYLERYASSSANLKAVLMRKVWRAERESEVDREAAEGWIEAVVAKFESAGLLDDRAYAEMRVMSLRRQGESARSIRQKLAAKGVDGDTIDCALDQDEDENDDLVAAIAYARRRRLGPFHTGGERAARREKDLAALARKGFGLDTCRAVIDAHDEDELLERECELRG
jgi:regulatory protein